MNSYFILSLVSLLSAIAIVALKVCYASKCERVEFCWGGILIDREPRLENREISNSNLELSTPDVFKQKKILKNDREEVATYEEQV
jgi:hypothetical protein